MDTTTPATNYTSVFDAHFDRITKGADRLARALVRRLRLPQADRDDLKQDFMLAVWKRLPSFNPARGHICSFATVIMKSEARQYARRLFLERGLFLCIPTNQVGSDKPDLVREHFVTGSDPTETADIRLHFKDVIPFLRPSDIGLLAAIGEHGPTQIWKTNGISRATAFRHREELRRRLTMLGLAA